MRQILPYFRSFTTGIITIPVNFLLKLLTRQAEGPLGATAIMFLVLLFANFALVIPMLFFHKNKEYLAWWAQGVALMNILTTQYILLLPCGALLFQIRSWFRHGIHIDARVLVFLTLIFPLGGGIALSLGFAILGGLRYTTMPENHIVIPALSLMRDLHGAPWFSWGYFTDLIRTLFPFAAGDDTLIVKILRIYFLIASLWFSFDVWMFYYGKNNSENKEFRIKTGAYIFNWKGTSLWRKISSVSLALLLASISAALLYNSASSFVRHYRIASDGTDTYAVPDPAYYDKSGNGSYEIKYSFMADNRVYESTLYVDYPFHYYAGKSLKQIPIRYLNSNPSINRIQYSAVYRIHEDFNNGYGGNLLIFLIGIGFLAGTLYAFPGMIIMSKQ